MVLPAIGLGETLNLGLAISLIYNMPDTSDNAPPVDWPKKKPGKYLCYCRAQGTNCEGQRAYGFGVGVGSSLGQAKAIAVKAAVSSLPQGFGNIHHVACKCMTPKGEKRTPHSD